MAHAILVVGEVADGALAPITAEMLGAAKRLSDGGTIACALIGSGLGSNAGDAIALGATVYIPDYDGLSVPIGTVHDGCFFAGDTGFSIAGRHIDLFAGTRAHFLAVDTALNGLDRVKLTTGADVPCP